MGDRTQQGEVSSENLLVNVTGRLKENGNCQSLLYFGCLLLKKTYSLIWFTIGKTMCTLKIRCDWPGGP